MTALCPGGLWHRRAASEEQGVTRPYAIAAVVPQEKEFQSDHTCIQSFLIEIVIYGDEKTDNTGKIAGYLCAWDLDVTIFQSLSARVLGFFPSAESLDLDSQEKSGQDVVLATKQWELVLHYTLQSVPSN